MNARTRHVQKCLTRRQMEQRVNERIASLESETEAKQMLNSLRKVAIQLLDTRGLIVVKPVDSTKVVTAYRMDSYDRKVIKNDKYN